MKIDGKVVSQLEFKEEKQIDAAIDIKYLQVGQHKIELSSTADFKPQNDVRKLSFTLTQVGFQ